MARAAAMPDEPEIDSDVEPRLRRLEQAVAALGDTQLMEDRVVERVVRRIEPTANGGTGGVFRLFRGKPKPDAAPIADGPEPEPEPPPSSEPAPRSGWLVPEIVQEIRAMVRMCTDYRYRMSWAGWVVPMACIMIGVLSWLLIGSLPVVGGIADRIINVLLVVIVYKALRREVDRYCNSRGG